MSPRPFLGERSRSQPRERGRAFQMNQHAKQPDNRAAFTLIEVMVACAILAIIAGVVALSLRGRIRATQLAQANSQIEAADRAARNIARNNGLGATISFDARDNEVRVQVARRVHKIVRLPAAVTLGSVRVGRGRSRAADGLVVSPLGQSPTYAVELTYGEQSRWIVVAGLSGQAFRTQKTEQVDALLRF